MPFTRRFKKEKRVRMTYQAIVEDCTTMMRQMGYEISDPTDLPAAMRHMLSGATVEDVAPDASVPRLEPDIILDDSAGDEFDGFGETEPLNENGPRMITEAAPDLMMQQWKEAQAKLLERVATEGVHHRGGAPSPSEGKKIAPHPSIKIKPPATRPPPPNPIGNGLGDDDNAEDDGPDNGRRNPHTGLTLEEQRAIIEKYTGAKPKPPGMGMPNTLKR